MDKKHLDQLITQALAIEAEEAKEAGALGFVARALVQATMPHKKHEVNEFVRTNGSYTLTMLAPSKIGLPYGSMPRLLLSWLTTEAVRTQQRELYLGNSLSEFMRELDLSPTGGRWGSITRLKDQARRLFSTSINCQYIERHNNAINELGRNFTITDKHNLWWQPKDINQPTLFESTVQLSQPFYDEVTNNPIPVDMRALKALKQSPMALDIYFWLTYRMSYLRKTTVIPWEALQAQFGADYEISSQGTRNFKKKFLMHLQKVTAIYPEAKAANSTNGLMLKPSKTHIKKIIVDKPVDK